MMPWRRPVTTKASAMSPEQYFVWLLTNLGWFLGFDTSMFNAILPITTFIVCDKIMEEQAQAHVKIGKVITAGNIYQ